MYRVAVTQVIKTVEYDHWEAGSGTKVDGSVDHRYWFVSADYLKALLPVGNSLDNLGAVLERHLEQFGLRLADFEVAEDGELVGSVNESTNGEVLRAEEARRWHERGHQLYACEYRFRIELLTVRLPESGELKRLLTPAQTPATTEATSTN